VTPVPNRSPRTLKSPRPISLQVLDQARASDLQSDEHFSVDGTLIEAWASQKSFQRKDDHPVPPPDDPVNRTVNFQGEAQ
jgi:hypothetical protein